MLTDTELDEWPFSGDEFFDSASAASSVTTPRDIGRLFDTEAPEVGKRDRNLRSPSSQGRNWVFTINNPTDDDYARLDSAVCQYLVYQTERGESGTVHIQGLACFEKRTRLNQVRRTLGERGHYEIMRGTIAQAEAYCTKEESRLEGGRTATRGIRPAGQGARGDLQPVVHALRAGASEADILAECPELFIKYHGGIRRAIALRTERRTWKTEVFWYFGPTGTGKTHRAFGEAPEAYFKAPNHYWWDGYTGQDDVIIDDYRPDFCKFSELLRLLDRYPLQIQIKGGCAQFLAKRIFITSPKSPSDTWESRSDEDLNQLFRRITQVVHFTETAAIPVPTNFKMPVILRLK